jgi:NADH-quinone oxidoreductase subunit C
MSTVPPAEGSGGDVTKDEASSAADGQPTAGAQGEGRYSSAEGADGDAAPDAPKQEQGGTAPVGEPGAKAGEDEAAAAGGDAAAPVETLHGCPLVDSLGAAVVHCNRDQYGDLMAGLKADGYNLMVGVSGVDYLSHPGRDLPEGVTAERFEVVVELARVGDRSRLRVRCQVPAADPVLPSLFDLWAGSEAHERETYDMFGISFAGHPDPSRILMPEDWEGHPLRKDYAIGRIPVQFKESPGGR